MIRYFTLALVLMVAMPLFLYAQPDIGNNQIQELYEKGNSAFKAEEYGNALKYLYAFRIVSKGRLKKNPKLTDGVDKRITISELMIKNALVIYLSTNTPSKIELGVVAKGGLPDTSNNLSPKGISVVPVDGSTRIQPPISKQAGVPEVGL